MVSPMNFYAGIDPGATGGLAVIDRRGSFVTAHRWQAKDPAKLFTLLQALKGQICGYLYLELVQTFPQMASGFQNRNQGLLVNLGIWQGFLMAAGIDYELISPLTWQSVHGLQSWQKRQAAAGPGDHIPHSPLTLARKTWPQAPLEFQADDGKAVALLLADMARIDDSRFVDRRSMRLAREEKEKAKKKRIRDNKKAATGPQDRPFSYPNQATQAAAPLTRPQPQVNPQSPRQQPQARPKFVFYPD